MTLPTFHFGALAETNFETGEVLRRRTARKVAIQLHVLLGKVSLCLSDKRLDGFTIDAKEKDLSILIGDTAHRTSGLIAYRYRTLHAPV